MPLQKYIGILTRELVCFHEAGHIVTAACIGATPVRVSFMDGPPPHAVSSIERSAPQAAFIACGGFAAENFLLQSQRLVDPFGRPADAALFLSEAWKNASEDVQNFIRAMALMGTSVDNARDHFTAIALGNVYPQIDFALVEEVAAALLERKALGPQELDQLLKLYRSNYAKIYRLERMIGFGRLQSAWLALKS